MVKEIYLVGETAALYKNYIGTLHQCMSKRSNFSGAVQHHTWKKLWPSKRYYSECYISTLENFVSFDISLQTGQTTTAMKVIFALAKLQKALACQSCRPLKHCGQKKPHTQSTQSSKVGGGVKYLHVAFFQNHYSLNTIVAVYLFLIQAGRMQVVK